MQFNTKWYHVELYRYGFGLYIRRIIFGDYRVQVLWWRADLTDRKIDVE